MHPLCAVWRPWRVIVFRSMGPHSATFGANRVACGLASRRSRPEAKSKAEAIAATTTQ
jgi:hypothetical protein